MPAPGTPPSVPADNPLYRRSDWAVVRKKVVAAAYRFVATLPAAKDLAQKAILTCLADPREPWGRPRRQLVGYLVRVASRVAYNERTHLESFPQVQAAEDVHGEDEEEGDGIARPLDAVLRSRGKNPEEAVSLAQEEAIFARRLSALAAMTREDAPVALLVDAVMRDEESPMKVALAAGFSAEDIYNARKRLARAAQAVLDEEEKANKLH